MRTENPELIAENKVIAIRNGRRQIVKGFISLQLDIFGRITEEKDDIKATGEINISEKELPKRERRERRDDRGERRVDREQRGERRERGERGERPERRRYDAERDYDRRPRREDREGGNRRDNREDRRDNREDRRDNRDNRRDERPSKITKIKDIGPGDEDLTLKVKVVELKERVEKFNDKERTYLDCLIAD